MSQGLEIDVREIVLSNSSFGPQEINRLTASVSHDYSNFGLLRDAVAELEDRSEEHSPATSVRLGVCYYLLGRYQRAAETLQAADGSALALYYLGKARFALGQYAAAIEHYQAAQGAGYSADECSLSTAEAQRNSGEPDAALATLDALSGAVEQTAEYLHQRGATVAVLGGSREEVVALYERAVEADDDHCGALFGLAMENDRWGNDEVALRLYERAASRFPTHVGVLLNLGLLYEDREDYEKAGACFQRVLDTEPNHDRARLYRRDAAASSNMRYDEDEVRLRDRLNQVLNTPVTDFELSVRSRNCLEKMGIMTLGDLTRVSEAELLASKNFGETSLVEIREMLSSKGLELGQHLDETPPAAPPIDTSNMSPDEQALLERPISDLNLSVRARKCMVRLRLSTIGELIRKTGDDLLECKNFGVTSLSEVREKLAQMNLKLRGD